MSESRDQTRADLRDALLAWLPLQRWFAGKSREISRLTPEPIAEMSAAPIAMGIWLVHAEYADGGRETYQVPLVMRDEPEETLAHALVGTVGGRFCYDAPWDKAVTPLWLEGIAAQSSTPPLRFVRTAEVADIPVDSSSLVSTAEQSNTSAVFGDAAILKLYRRVESGRNPDVEIHEALTSTGAHNIARLLGYVEADLPDGPTDLAMLQEFMTTASDGWDLAKISVRDLMAEADLLAEEAGGDFAAESYRLGQTTAAVHAELAEAFGTSTLTPAELSERAEAMQTRLTEALREVPALAAAEDGLRETFRAFLDAGPVTVQRIHGDLHLGQMLRTAQRWIMLDFEGEPAKPISERRVADSPLRDVAGMLRSFDYAAHHQFIDTGTDPQRSYRAVEWSDRNRDWFCNGYAETAGHDPREQVDLLTAFEAEKAVYETMYEARNRPSWLPVPMATLDRIAHRAEEDT